MPLAVSLESTISDAKKLETLLLSISEIRADTKEKFDG